MQDRGIPHPARLHASVSFPDIPEVGGESMGEDATPD
jgi:hypothetical protein